MRQSGFSNWAWWALLCLALWHLPPRCSQRVRGVTREALAPLHAGVTALGSRLRESFLVLRGWGGVVQENRRLAEEIAYLRGRVRHLESFQRENLALRRQLQFLDASEGRLLPAEVIGREISGWWDALRIARGSQDGLQRNMAVITPDGLAGKVEAVQAHTAEVMLLSDPSLRISARISRTGAFGIVRGTGAPLHGRPLFRMDFIDANTTVVPGDEVVTSGLGTLYTRGLFIGHVERVAHDASGLYQTATLVPGADLGDLTYVFLVMGRRVLAAQELQPDDQERP